MTQMMIKTTGSTMAAIGAALVLLLAMAATSATAQYSWQDFVDLHNAARAVEGVGEVFWDGNVAAFAENYAALRAGDCAMEHSDRSEVGYGENIWWGSAGRDWSAADAVDWWVAEKQYYDYGSNSCFAPAGKSCGHYTQVVWRDTTAIGCARVVCDNDAGVFITCNYNPPGNFEGQWPFLATN